jgi:hypothetical protein
MRTHHPGGEVRFSHERMVLIADKQPVPASGAFESVRQIENPSSISAAGIIVQSRSGYPPSGAALVTGPAVKMPLAGPVSLAHTILTGG